LKSDLNLKFTSKNIIFISITLLLIIFFGYWLKLQRGLDFFDSFSLSGYFPFKYLSDNNIESPEKGILISEDFDKKRLFKSFSELWMKEKGTAKKAYSSDGYKGSRCFLVINSSSGSWASSYRKKFKVKKGDHFYIEGFTKITGHTPHAYLSVAAFDKNDDAINWNYFRKGADKKGKWIQIDKHFIIPNENIKSINFRLVGVGKGEYLFDNILFCKLN